MPKHLKKLTEEILHQNHWWTYKHDTYEKPNGEVGDYFYGETPGMAIIVPVMTDGSILLTLQHRYLEDKQSIEFPGGGTQKGQTPLESAQRELFEETGCIAKEYIKMGSFQPCNGMMKDVCHVFLAHVIEQKQAQPDDTEEFELLYRLPEELDEMIRKNEIWDGETMAAWALVHHYFLHQ